MTQTRRSTIDMLNKSFLANSLLAMCVLVATGCFADDSSPEAISYYFGFEIERITGIHEEEIEELGCRYTGDSQVIESALTKVDARETSYDRRDVRAKIEMLGKTYYVDRDGETRQGDDYFRLDKVKFVESIELASPCE